MEFERCAPGPRVIPPGEEFQTQGDNGRVERKSDVRKFAPGTLGLVEPTRPTHEHLGDGKEELPITMLIGMGQVCPADRPAKAHLVESIASAQETADNIPKTVPKGQLRKTQSQEMVVVREIARSSFCGEGFSATVKLAREDDRGDLGENSLHAGG